MKRLLWWAAVTAYAAMIFWISSVPNPLPLLTSRISDKALHVLLYAGFGVLVCRALRALGLGAGRAFGLALLAGSLYGASDEMHQRFVPTRSAEIFDWVADTAGAGLGAAATAAAAFLRGRGAAG